jgi:hypothetical protein
MMKRRAYLFRLFAYENRPRSNQPYHRRPPGNVERCLNAIETARRLGADLDVLPGDGDPRLPTPRHPL